MLTVIEGRAIEYIREMQDYTVNDNAGLLKEENERKKVYTGERASMFQE